MIRYKVKTLDGGQIERRLPQTPADCRVIRAEEIGTKQSLTDHSFGDVLNTKDEQNALDDETVRDLGPA